MRGSRVKFQIIAGELCLDFVNTLDNRPVPERKKELLESYSDLLDWAMEAGVLSSAQRGLLEREYTSHPAEGQKIHKKAIELRECLYRILTAAARNRIPSDVDLQTFNGYVKEA